MSTSFILTFFCHNVLQSYFWKGPVFLLGMISMIPFGFVTAMTCSTALVILNFTKAILRRLIVIEASTNDLCKLGQLYREIQVFTLICNGAFENYVWGVTQFIGGSGVIPLLYGLVTLHENMCAWMLATWILFTVITVVYTGLTFHVGCQPVNLSEKLLGLFNRRRRKCEWSQKFFRSCTVIAMRTGEFHELDRKRGRDFPGLFCSERRFLWQTRGRTLNTAKSINHV